VGYNVRCTALAGKAQVVGRQHFAVHSETEFHGDSLAKNWVWLTPPAGAGQAQDREWIELLYVQLGSSGELER
jgi:hypothetical protein